MNNQSTITESFWGRAAREARAQLGEAKVRAGSLKAAIRLFEAKEKNADPYPAEAVNTKEKS